MGQSMHHVIAGHVHTRDNDLMSIWVWPPESAAKSKRFTYVPLNKIMNHDRGASTPT